MDKKNQVLLTTIAVATLLVAVVGATFAYFSARIVENNKTTTKLKSAELEIAFTGTQEITTDCVNGSMTVGGNTISCVDGNSWEPGNVGTKIFTVENTSDYDMTFDINFTKVVNNFSRTQDLTYSLTAAFTESTNSGYTTSSTVQMVTGGTGVANSTKAPLSVSNRVMPTDNTSSVAIDGTVTYGTNTTQIVKIFIPKHTKQQFSLVVAYVDAVDGNNQPVDQNEDQGKVFRATVEIEPNGIDAGTQGS